MDEIIKQIKKLDAQPSSIELAIEFANLLPKNIQVPQVSVIKNGEVVMAWEKPYFHLIFFHHMGHQERIINFSTELANGSFAFAGEIDIIVKSMLKNFETL